MATNGRRKPLKSPAPPIDLEEIEQDPGFRGMLSFLDVSPEERAQQLAQRDHAERSRSGDKPRPERPMGDRVAPEIPVADLPTEEVAVSSETGVTPTDQLPHGVTPQSQPPMGEQTEGQIVEAGDLVEPAASADGPTGEQPRGQLRTAESAGGGRAYGQLEGAGAVPYIDVEGRGKRPLRYCRTAQDGHTSTEQLAYQTLCAYARRHGSLQDDGAFVVDIGLSQICRLFNSDHKNAKRLLGTLQEKLAIEVVSKPDYRRAIPTRYRIYNPAQVLDRRRRAGLVWVVRTRAVRFVPLDAVERLLREAETGETPMGEQSLGGAPAAPGFPVSLAHGLKGWLPIGDDAVQQLWDRCRRGSPDCTEDEVAWFCRAKEGPIRAGRIEDPVALILRTVPPLFAGGGTVALEEYRRDRERDRERERQRERQVAQLVLDDPASSEAERAWAAEVLEPGQGSH